MCKTSDIVQTYQILNHKRVALDLVSVFFWYILHKTVPVWHIGIHTGMPKYHTGMQECDFLWIKETVTTVKSNLEYRVDGK